jgi:hypothetical protein
MAIEIQKNELPHTRAMTAESNHSVGPNRMVLSVGRVVTDSAMASLF